MIQSESKYCKNIGMCTIHHLCNMKTTCVKVFHFFSRNETPSQLPAIQKEKAFSLHRLFCCSSHRLHIMESSHHSHVTSVGFCCGDASMFHDPLVPSPLLPSVTAVITVTPGTVHQHLLRQDLQGARLKDKSKASLTD